MITAPYNFVPLNKEVFYPTWSEQVSHDIPFSDGESGEIGITITAKSPIFIRNHYVEGDNFIEIDGKKTSIDFCHHNKIPYIPATSIKGMVRNVLEIMSFSKMNFIDDKTYSVRDLSKAKNFYFNKINASPTYCGWLFRDTDGKLKIEDCGEPLRIKYDEIERKFAGEFKKSKFCIQNSVLNNKVYKWLYKKLNKDLLSEEIKNEYEKVENSNDSNSQNRYSQKLRSKFATGFFDDKDSPFKKAYEKYSLINENIYTNIYHFSASYTDSPGRKIVTFEDNGPNIGKLVLTGHPSSRVENKDPNDEYKIKGTGKIFDFVFIQKENSDNLDVSQKVFDNFKFAYFDGRKTQPKESEDWSFWKERLKDNGRVPVFFHKNGKEITSFGLSNLYKFPYSKSIMQTLLKNHTSDEIDLSETIFGFSKKIDNKQVSLKGRVQFSHAKKICGTETLNARYVLLGTPKASYYPIYLVQTGGEYKTLMNSDSVLAGWKRYPIHKNFTHQCDGESTQTSKITPLGENSQFSLKVRFHNLKKVEIGALISAITFHNNSSQFFHSLGLAKSYGYGKVSLKITKMSNLQYSQEDYMKAFESAMNYEIFGGLIKWHESEEIKNLFTMAKPQNDRNLEYMELTEFAKQKTDREYLHRYITLKGVTLAKPNKLCSIDEIELYKNKVQELKAVKERKKKEELEAKKEKAELEAKIKKEQEAFNLALNSDNPQTIKNFIANNSGHEKISELETKLNQLQLAKEQNEFKELNEQVQKAFDNAISQKDKNNRKKFLQTWIMKWEKLENNKGSTVILALVEQAKKELK